MLGIRRIENTVCHGTDDDQRSGKEPMGVCSQQPASGERYDHQQNSDGRGNSRSEAISDIA